MILPLTIRCSETDRVFSCHGSLTAVPLVPPRPDDDSSSEGSLLHYLIAKRLVLELGATEPEGGLVPPVLPKGFKLAAFSAWIVDWAVKQVRDTVPPDWSLMVEVPIAYRYELPRPIWISVDEVQGEIPPEFVVKDGRVLIDHFILSGHKDVFAISPDGKRAKAKDWKTGQVGAEPADTNWQAASYLGLGKMGWPDLQEYEFELDQPRIDEEATGIPRVSSTTLDFHQLDAMNLTLAEEVNTALENRFETDSGIKQCKYCSVGWRCPSIRAEKEFMKSTLTPEILAEMKDTPNDAQLGDFVISGRTLSGPVASAEELLHARIDAQGYLDAGCGARITRKTRPGQYKITNPVGAWNAVNTLIPTTRMPDVVRYSKDRLVDVIADVHGIHKSGKGEDTAERRFRDQIAGPNMEQGETRILVFSQ